MVLPERSETTSSIPDDDMLDIFLSLDTPPGYRAELIDQEIVVTPPPQAFHEGIIHLITRAINRGADTDFWLAGNRGLITPLGRFIPDITVGHESGFSTREHWTDCTDVELVCEVTSHDPHRDRHAKRRGYAQAQIPLYLLVDRTAQTVS
ncbi:MAG: Uma2 family endonuclease, partial [Stackebrandtia sp.]